MTSGLQEEEKRHETFLIYNNLDAFPELTGQLKADS